MSKRLHVFFISYREITRKERLKMKKHDVASQNDLINLCVTLLLSNAIKRNPNKFKKSDHKKSDSDNKKKCECKGKLRNDVGIFKIFANVCPQCNDKKSEVIASFNFSETVGFLFKSKDLTKPICDKIIAPEDTTIIGRTLETGGVGKVVTPTGTFDAAFSLSMFESFGLETLDNYAFSLTYIDGTGIPVTFTASVQGIDDQDLSIEKCQFGHCDLHEQNHRFDSDSEGFDFDGGSPNTISSVAAPRFITYTINGIPQTIDLNALNNNE